MKGIKLLFSVMLLTGTLGLSAAPVWAEDFLVKDPGEDLLAKGPAANFLVKDPIVPDSNYCHLRFPAIREESLYWDRPLIKDRGTNDIIDFYGPCDHDPLGEEEVRRQRVEYSNPRVWE